jgi:hypothetical protein
MMGRGGQEAPVIARSHGHTVLALSLALLVAGSPPVHGLSSETERLAGEVGPTGHVWATEIDVDDVEKIEKRASRAGLENVTAVLGTDTDTGLPDGCCEAVLLRMVYHHFTQPASMRASLRRALRPGALLAVIDLQPRGSWGSLDGVPDRGGHGIRDEELVAEMTSDGFEVVARYDDWNGSGNRYCVVFRRTEGSGAADAAR